MKIHRLSTAPNMYRLQQAKILAPFWLAVALFAFSSCATRIATDITGGSKLPAKGKGETFVLAPARPSIAAEAATYSREISAGLERYGWRPSQGPSADYIVTFDYGQSGTKKVLEPRPMGVIVVVVPQTKFIWFLQLSIKDRAGMDVYDSHSERLSNSSHSPRVISAIINGLFKNFPVLPQATSH